MVPLSVCVGERENSILLLTKTSRHLSSIWARCVAVFCDNPPNSRILRATSITVGGFAVNRKRLKTALERQGFLNYENEWWHFSYDVEHPVRFDRVVR